MADKFVGVSPDSTGLGPKIETETLTVASGATVHRQVVAPIDFMLRVPEGDIPGHASVNKFGENPEVASGVQEDVWDGAGQYPYPATALITSMSQTADQNLMRGATIEWQGLDANWNPVTQTKTLDAALTTNVVTLDTPMLRVFRGRVLANVVGDSPIRCHNAGETVDYAIISTGNNQTEMALYTIPLGKSAYMTGYYGSVVPVTNKDPEHTEFKIWAADRANSYEFQLKHSLSAPQVWPIANFKWEPYLKFTAQTDIRVTATPSNQPAHVHAGFDLILVDD